MKLNQEGQEPLRPLPFVLLRSYWITNVKVVVAVGIVAEVESCPVSVMV
jgi:hypothetical protein